MADHSPLVLPGDPQKQLHLLAFYDFCLDLFEEGLERFLLRRRSTPNLVKGFLSENNLKHDIFCCLVSRGIRREF